jgi:hypothetical protein
MLEAIEDEEGLLVQEPGDETVTWVPRPRLTHAQVGGKRARHRLRIGHRCQLHEKDAVRKRRPQATGDLQGHPRLADAAGANKGDECDVWLPEQGTQSVHEAVASHQGSQAAWQKLPEEHGCIMRRCGRC